MLVFLPLLSLLIQENHEDSKRFLVCLSIFATFTVILSEPKLVSLTTIHVLFNPLSKIGQHFPTSLFSSLHIPSSSTFKKLKSLHKSKKREDGKRDVFLRKWRNHDKKLCNVTFNASPWNIKRVAFSRANKNLNAMKYLWWSWVLRRHIKWH